MLSQRMNNLATSLQEAADTGRMSDVFARVAAQELSDLALQAEALEAVTVPLAARFGGGQTFGENVIGIAAVLAKRGVRAGMPPEGGAA